MWKEIRHLPNLKICGNLRNLRIFFCQQSCGAPVGRRCGCEETFEMVKDDFDCNASARSP